MHLQGIPDDALIKELDELYRLIFFSAYFGTAEMIRFTRLQKELWRRGYDIRISSGGGSMEVTHA